MGEPFKNLINRELIAGIGSIFKQQWAEFDLEGFVAQATADLENQELKQRCFAIVEALETHLPNDYLQASRIIERSLGLGDAGDEHGEASSDERRLKGMAIMAIQEYVGRNGMGHVGVSLNLLREMTKGSSSEFGIRYFLRDNQLETLKTMQVWVKDPDEHVRRLVSEGTRPRLPWGMQLKRFIKDPSPIIPLLEVLKDDPSEYVRRSVANNLNDISKDHPDIVCMIAEHWIQGASTQRIRLLRHALRTLVKKGNARALAIMGFSSVEFDDVSLKVETEKVLMGETLVFSIDFVLGGEETQTLLIDYAVHFQKANGTLKPKVFKWKQIEAEPGKRIRIERSHSFREVTVRKYYPGDHEIELLINGNSFAKSTFELVASSQTT